MLKPLSAFGILAALAGGTYTLGYAPLPRERVALGKEIHDLRGQIQALEARIAALDRPEGTGAPQAISLAAKNEDFAVLALQALVVETAGDTGIDLSSYGAAVLNDAPIGKVVAVELEGQGTLQNHYRFLQALETMRPEIAIRHLSLRPGYRQDREQRDVVVQQRMLVWAYWEAEA